MFKTCQQFKKIKTLYEHLPPDNIAELKLWDTVNVDLIGPYSKSIRKHQPGCTFIRNNDSLTCMMMIDPATSQFKIADIPTFDLEEVTIGNDEYMDKSSARVIQLFNSTWLCRYPCPQKVVFENGSEFKRDFTLLLKDFDIKPVLTSVKNPQDNAPVERVHKVILNMLVTKDLGKNILDYIDQWGDDPEYGACEIRDSYHCTIMATPGQDVFGKYMLFNLVSVVDWQVVTAENQR